MGAIARGIGGVLTTIGRAIAARPVLFAAVALAVVALDALLPVVVLSTFRKPFEHFSFNPWLKHAWVWTTSPDVTLARKIEFLSGVALFWFISGSSYGEPAWGFSASPPDVIRWLYMGVVFGAYFALWSYARSRGTVAGFAAARGGRGGAAGAVLSTLGLVVSPCGVAGCGAPILPVLALGLQGLTSGALALIATVSHVATLFVLIGGTLAVLVLAGVINRADTDGQREAQAAGPAPRGTVPA